MMHTQQPKYVFFWKPDGPNGWAGQWYRSPITATLSFTEGEPEKSITFTSAEQYMMLRKALLFRDAVVAQKILAVTGGAPGDMKRIKALGREVSNFDERVWVAEREKIVLEGNLLKFRQNTGLREELTRTGDAVMVEASPFDRIWGIGYGEKNAPKMKEKWGLNLLGKVLVETRRILRDEAKAVEANIRAEKGSEARPDKMTDGEVSTL